MKSTDKYVIYQDMTIHTFLVAAVNQSWATQPHTKEDFLNDSKRDNNFFETPATRYSTSVIGLVELVVSANGSGTCGAIYMLLKFSCLLY